ncbi:hypothetical protein K437DRAFT_253995 [Tilletiaria anomala UBC 951]|uniref:WKF domain-containing protein n=1 Tax=Tilletiaria anomala (strain ATCC 24038 / CBS 436.72 / UBC 951) TaxID=1037660 RepID=A0A066WFL4_TILAU|nr:uncharacterized protein K437DRAFT_253995 [Tilletiaria anomala UBC 951]KDN52591.1 hypothetical protein K437DRAFT_253995 [Tilletiaria anomala UBC 951]
MARHRSRKSGTTKVVSTNGAGPTAPAASAAAAASSNSSRDKSEVNENGKSVEEPAVASINEPGQAGEADRDTVAPATEEPQSASKRSRKRSKRKSGNTESVGEDHKLYPPAPKIPKEKEEDGSDSDSDDGSGDQKQINIAGTSTADGETSSKRKRKRKRKSTTGVNQVVECAADTEQNASRTKSKSSPSKSSSIAKQSAPASRPYTSVPPLSSAPDPFSDPQLVQREGGTDAAGEEEEDGPGEQVTSSAQNALAYVIAFAAKDAEVGGNTGGSKADKESSRKKQKTEVAVNGTVSTWRFNKAKQNWLLRHLLNAPSSQTLDESTANASDESSASSAQGAKAAGRGVAIPDEYVPFLGWYFKGIQGNARRVLVNELKQARDAPAHAQVTLSGPGNDSSDAAPSASATAAAPLQGAGSNSSNLAFGDMALSMEASADAAQATTSVAAPTSASAPAAGSAQDVETSRARAKEILAWMGESG